MITSYIAKIADVVLFPLLELPPLLAVIILSLAFSLIVLLFQRKVFWNEKVREAKLRLEEIKEKAIRLQNRKQEEFDKILNEMLKLNTRIMKENLKVTLLSLVLGIIVISWVSFHYSGYYIKLPFPYFNNIGLLYFYVMLSLLLGVVIGKLLEVR